MIQFKVLKLPTFATLFANQRVASFIGKLDAFFIKLPHLPKKIRLLISKIVPYFALILGTVGLLASIMTGFFLILTVMALDWEMLGEISFGFVLILLDTLFLLKAFKPLRQSDATGWIYLFWAQILEVVNFVVNLSTGTSQVLPGLAVILVTFYLLFEIGQFYVYRKSPLAPEMSAAPKI